MSASAARAVTFPMPQAEPRVEVERFRLDGNTTAEVYREWSFPAGVLRWWRDASERQGDEGLFTCPGWLEQCWKASETTLFVAVIRIKDEIRGIFPCHLSTTPWGDPAICSLTVDSNSYDFLTEGDPQAAVDAFARLVERRFPWFHLQFDGMSAASAAQVERSFQKQRYSTWTYSEPFAPYIPVDGDYEAYLASLAGTFRKDLRRRRRRAEEAGPLVWEVHRGLDGFHDLLEKVLAIEASGWKGQAGTAIAQKPKFERFVRGALEWAAREGKLQFLILRHKGDVLAFEIDLVHGGTVFGYRKSFDEQHASQYAPGHLILLEAIQRFFADPSIHKFTFLGECHPWKARWTQQSDRYHWVTIYPRTVKGRWNHFVRHGWKEPLKRSALAQAFVARLRRGR